MARLRTALRRFFTTGPSLLGQWRLLLLAGIVPSAAGAVVVVLVLSAQPPAFRLISVAFTFGLLWWWLRGYRLRRFPIWSSPLEALALVAVASGVSHPAHVLSFYYTGLYFRSLYGSLPEVMGRSALFLAAYFLALVLLADSASDSVPAFINAAQVTGIPVSAWISYTLGRIVAQHERSAKRDRVLSQTSGQLVAAIGPAEIWQAVRQTVGMLTEDIGQGSAAVVDGRCLAAVDEAGRPREDGAFRIRLSSLRRAIWRELEAGRPVQVREPLPEVRRIFAFRTELRHLSLVPVLAGRSPAGVVAVASGQPLQNGDLDGLMFLTREAGLALERAALAQEVRASEARFRSLVQNALDVIMVTDAAGAVQYASPGIQRTLGYAPEEVQGRPCWDWLHTEDAPELRAVMTALTADPGSTRTLHLRGRHRDGSWRWLETRVTNLLQDPAVQGFVLNQQDVTDRKTLEAELLYQARRDPLTGLANRTLFRDRVEEAVERCRQRGGQVAVLFIDLDEFKAINDSLGHNAGDRALVEVGRRLLRHLRSGTSDAVARLGGDEFAVLLKDLYNIHQARRVAQGILETLQEPLELEGREMVIGASIGIAVGYGGQADADQLLRNADVAMYAAKRQGKGRYALFEPIMHSRALERLDLVGSLRRALDRGELAIYYQPVVWLQPVRIIGVEALLRWMHPERGMILPNEFIPLAEETDLILPIGRWLLQEACQQARRWQSAFPSDPPLTVGVNISTRQLQQRGLTRDVAEALQRSGLEPLRLVLEITETAAMHDAGLISRRLQELKELGVRLAVDDFGTGYTSLSHLRRFPLDILKIDKSFVRGVGGEPEEAEFIEAIIRLGHTLHLRTVAEGIESMAQLTRLQMLGCDSGQGYLFSPPVDAAGMEAILRRAAADEAWWRPDREAASA